MVWMVYWRVADEQKTRWETASTKDAAMSAALRMRMSPNITVTQITGPDGEVLKPEDIPQDGTPPC